MPTPQRISVFGLGYVGSVTAACLASRGCPVIGVDVHPRKVELINSGRAPIAEPGLDELMAKHHEAGLISATTDAALAIRETEVSLVCVGTPSTASGDLDLTYVEAVTRQIADALSQSEGSHALIYRSTMLPGSTRRFAEKYLSDLIETGRVSVYFFPEFLRQGTAIEDFRNPSLSAVGTYAADGSVKPIQGIVDEGTGVTDLETAELLKYACNAFHAVKVSFANEIGRIGKAAGIDSSQVMELLCADERLNISPYYLRPGNPFGGSCLPKDVSALRLFARSHNVAASTLNSLLESNQEHLEHLISIVERTGKRSVALLGLAFKAGTDDLRGSALVELAAALLLKGFQVRIFDPAVAPENLLGANERFANLRLPLLDTLLTENLEEAVASAEVLVVSKRCAEIEALAKWVTPDHHVIDVNGWRNLGTLPSQYQGLCW